MDIIRIHREEVDKSPLQPTEPLLNILVMSSVDKLDPMYSLLCSVYMLALT